MSRQVTASESAPAGHMNLSSRSLAIQVNDTLKEPTDYVQNRYNLALD
jgi:hypothetical protein